MCIQKQEDKAEEYRSNHAPQDLLTINLSLQLLAGAKKVSTSIKCLLITKLYMHKVGYVHDIMHLFKYLAYGVDA